MSVEWFDKKPGGDLVKEFDGGFLFAVGDVNWVRVPVGVPGEESGQRKILEMFEAPCPVTGVVCTHYALEGGLYVADSDKFYWYRKD